MTEARIALSRLLRRPDLLLACGGLLYGIYQASRILPTRPLHPVVIAILVASSAYLVLRGRLPIGDTLPQHTASPAICRASDIVFALACAVAMLTWHRSLYVLPPAHYFALVVAAGTILWDVPLGRTGHRGTAAMLTKVIILGLLVRGAAYTLFPGPIGSDPWQHTLTVQVMAETGRIPLLLPNAMGTQNGYATIPVFHILSACMGQVAGVSAKTAVFLAGSVPMVLSCVVIFLIGRNLLSTGAGVLAALMYCVSDYAILWGVQIIAMTLASALGVCLLWLLLSGRPVSGASVTLVLLLMVALVLCHTVSAFVTFVALAAVTIGLRIVRMTEVGRFSERTTLLLTPSIVALYGAFMLVWWITMPTSTGDSFFAVQADKLARVLATASESQVPTSVSMAPLPYILSLQQHAGGAVLFGLGLYAVLLSLRLLRSSSRYLVPSIAVSALLAIQAVGSSSLQEALISARWVIFQYVLLAPLSAWVLLSLMGRIQRVFPRLLLATILCVVYVFPMLTNSVAVQSSPFALPSTPRMGYTTSEQTAWRTLVTELRATPVSDGYYTGAMATVTSRTDYETLGSTTRELFIERRNYLAHPELNAGYRTVIGDMQDIYLGYYRLAGQPVVLTRYAADLALAGGVVYDNNTTRMVQALS